MENAALFFSLLAFAGIIAGLLSGLLGVGGGIVVVPVLYYIFTQTGYSLDEAIHVAVGTSLATIIITQARSAWGHWQRGAIDPFILRRWAVPLFVGAVAGGAVGGGLSGRWLALTFATIMLVVAAMMLRQVKNPKEGNPARFGLAQRVLYPIAFASGFFSALAGVGGGIFNVSALTLLFGQAMHRVIGTAAALGVLIGVAGTATFILAGLRQGVAIDYSFGYVHLPAAALIILFSLVSAPWGVALSHRLPQRTLQIIFVALLLVASGKMFFEAL